MARRLALAGALLGSTLAVGCGLLLDFGGLTDGAGGSGGGSTSASSSSGMASSSSSSNSGGSSSSGSASSSGAGGADAGDDGGPIQGPLPPVHVKLGNIDVMMDATEVTAAQYLRFVKAYAAHPVTPTGDRCTWNTVVEPNKAPPNNDAGIGTNAACSAYDLQATATAEPDSPVRCVDWCDAFTYCQWAGGWLCHGDESGMYAREWRTACEGGVGKAYPYGNTYQAGACVNAPATKPADVHSKPACEGGVTGLFDMSGNVGEWLDCGCEYDNQDPTKTSAFVGGGTFLDMASDLSCTASRMESLTSFHPEIGMRCCYQTVP
jgi:formylglycine-generating enzyme required for sulfatase activity